MKTTNTNLLKKPKWILAYHYQANQVVWIGQAKQISTHIITAKNVTWKNGRKDDSLGAWYIDNDFHFEIIKEEQAKKMIFMIKTGITE